MKKATSRGSENGAGRGGRAGPALRLTAALLALLALGLAFAARAEDRAASDWFVTDQGEVRLVAAQAATGAERQVMLGLEFRLAPGWKIYWRSPGDAGYPPRLDWTGSDNLASAKVDWPAPRRFSVLGFETAGYTGQVVLPILATLKQPGEPLRLRLALDYLTCDNICIPYDAKFALDLPAGAAAAASPGYGALIARYAALVPGDGRAAGLEIVGAVLRRGPAPRLDLTLRSDHPLLAPDAFVEGAGQVSFGPPVLRAGDRPDQTTLRLPAHGADAALARLVDRPLAVTVVDGTQAMTATVVPHSGAAGAAASALPAMLVLALLGGLILNVMPCVLPVLSLKLLAAIEHGAAARGTLRLGFLATAAGILLSFAGLALAMIALTAAGLAVGWGVQFQQPLFLAAMTALLTLFAANLWGLFEVPLPPGFGALAVRGRGRALLGSVATGAFATLLATPCSAPFLGTAVGFALAAGPTEILAIFLALGFGFAAPYLLVAAMPGLARLLPQPGRWMLGLRRLLGVALAASAVWLVWVLAAEAGAAAACGIALLMAAMVLALLLLRRPWLRGAALAAAVAAALVLPAAVPPPPPAPHVADAFWRPFDPGRLGELVREGRVVFVDVTADWCLTCKVNEQLVLDSGPVRSRLAAPGVVAMRADWTRPDPVITAYLRRFGRYGIPFNAVYGPGAPAGVALPEILTRDGVAQALQQAEGVPPSDGRG